MKVMVTVKRVVDYNVRIQVKPDGSGVVTDGVKMSMNPFDEIAVEEALRLKEAGVADEIIVVSIGGKKSEEQLRTALAMGADRAVIVQTDDEVQSLSGARLMAEVAKREDVGLVIMGKQAIDGDAGQTPQMTAALLGWPQVTYASKIEIADGKASVTREIDAGLETLEVDLPAVVSADLRLNEPRYVKLPDIMKAKKKKIAPVTPEELGVTLESTLTVVKTTPPPARQAGKKVENVAELVKELKERGLVQ